jgi:hypothetical protein
MEEKFPPGFHSHRRDLVDRTTPTAEGDNQSVPTRQPDTQTSITLPKLFTENFEANQRPFHGWIPGGYHLLSYRAILGRHMGLVLTGTLHWVDCIYRRRARQPFMLHIYVAVAEKERCLMGRTARRTTAGCAATLLASQECACGNLRRRVGRDLSGGCAAAPPVPAPHLQPAKRLPDRRMVLVAGQHLRARPHDSRTIANET